MKNYDTREGIAKAVRTLEGLKLLARERSDAGYDRKERLSEWLVLGRLRMDTCGNTMRITEGVPDDIVYKLGPVSTFEELEKHLPEARVTLTSGHAIPNPDAECGWCKRGWTIDNWHETIFRTGEHWSKPDVYHPICMRYKLLAESTAHFEKILTQAGFPIDSMKAIPNGYCRQADIRLCCGPWFRVRSSIGILTIGWRKSVINIDWSELVLKEKPDFSKEQVTKWETGIHAWGPDKAAEYLKEIGRCAHEADD